MAFIFLRKPKYGRFCYFSFEKDHYDSQRNGKIKTKTQKTNHVFNNLRIWCFIWITLAYVCIQKTQYIQYCTEII